MLLKQTLALAAAFFVFTGSVCSGQANGDNPPAAPATDVAVTVTDYDTVSLNVQNTDLAQVLQLLSIQGRRNIVPSPQVTGTVTANLYDVTFHEALDAILQQNGCGYKEQGNFIYIYTLDQLRKIQDAERKLTHHVFRLNYITADDASAFVTPLLSSGGSISISGATPPGFQPTITDGGGNSNAHGDVMIVRDYAENVDEIKKVIDELDTRPKQVLVEATILKADVTENMAFGVDFSILSNIGLEFFANPLSAVSELISGAVTPTGPAGAVTSSVGNVSEGSGGLRIGVTSNNVSAFIRALDSVTDTTVLANPKLLVLNRQKAEVLVGEKIGYLSTTATATATTQTVEFLDTGTQLTVRPFVSEDGYIRMELKPQVSTARIRDVVPGTSTAAVTIPDEITQELTTNIMVRDGETVVLGGLFKEETSVTREQVPFLGDIPIAGAAFRGRDDELKRFEVVFLVTPHIIRENALYAAGRATKDGAEMVRIGAREHLLPWSRSKMSAGHIRQALEALDLADRDTALWEIDMALGLDPAAVEAIRLKEKLTGQRIFWPQHSMLEDAVELMVEQTTNRRVHRARPMQPDPRPLRPQSDDEPVIQPQPNPAGTHAPQDQAETQALSVTETQTITATDQAVTISDEPAVLDDANIVSSTSESTSAANENEEESAGDVASSESDEASADAGHDQADGESMTDGAEASENVMPVEGEDPAGTETDLAEADEADAGDMDHTEAADAQWFEGESEETPFDEATTHVDPASVESDK